MISRVIEVAWLAGRKIGICGQAPSDHPDFAQFLVEHGIDSISLNPDVVLKTTLKVLEIERAISRARKVGTSGPVDTRRVAGEPKAAATAVGAGS